MAHSNNKISYIQLPGSDIQYELHDELAIHDPAELGLSGVMIFKGTKATYAELPKPTDTVEANHPKIGDVWYVKDEDVEYVWVAANSDLGVEAHWEALGNIHDAASSTHTHNVTITGTNAASTVTGTVTVPDVSKTTKKMGASATQGAVTAPTDNVIGADTTHNTVVELNTTKLKATASGAAVGANGTAAAVTGYTPSTGTFATGVTTDTASVISSVTPGTASAVTGLGTPTTAKAITELNTTTIKNPTVTAVSIPNVTGNTSVKASKLSSAGSVSTKSHDLWSASVSNGVLVFSTTSHTCVDSVTLPTFTEVTATNTTLGTALSASSVSTSNVTVATSAKSTADAITGITPTTASFVNGITTGSADVISEVEASTGSAITALGTPTTATVLKGVKMTAQPTVTIAAGTTGDVTVATSVKTATVTHNTNDTVAAVTSVSVADPTVALNGNATTGVTYVDSVTVGTKSASLTNGSAAAQKWTQASGTTGQPQ